MQRNGYRTFILFLLIFIASAVSVAFASGAQEDRLQQAEALVEQKEYNAAMLLCTEILRTEPNRIEDVQALLTRIRREKDNYNDKYEELIEVYGGDDIEAAYPMIADLQEMDPNPNEATRVSLVLARETAGFVFNNNRWVDIMEDASAKIAAGQYAEAVESYTTGFDLSRVIFQDAGYGNIVVNDVFSRSEQMNNETLEFLELYSSLLSRRENIDNSFTARSLDEFITGVADIYSDLERTAEIRESLKDTADYFIVQEDNIRTTRGDDKQVHYLIYMDRLLNGRTTVDELEGITGVIDIFWNEIFKMISDDSLAYTEELFAEALAAYRTGNYDSAEQLFARVLEIAESSITVYEFGGNYFESESQYQRPGLLMADRTGYGLGQEIVVQSAAIAQEIPLIIAEQGRLSELENRIAALNIEMDNYRETGSLIREELTVESNTVEQALSDWEENLSGLADTDYGTDQAVERLTAAAAVPVDEYGEMKGRLFNYEVALASTLAGINIEQLEGDYGLVRDEVSNSAALIQGIAAKQDEAGTDNEVDFEIVYKYPDRALDQLTAAQQSVRNLLAGIEVLDQRIEAERAEIRVTAEIIRLQEGSAELLDKSSSLLSEAEVLADNARTQIFTAEKLKQEGERRIEESRQLTQQARFAAAKERLEQAAGKFDESLSYLEDPVLRTYRDNEIPRLYDEIQVAENNLVVRQVREYLTTGKSNYSQGNFPAAQAILIKAQSRWSDTNVEPNPEVEYWLTLTQTALSVTSGRIIAATDPLYTEMSQFLNQAQSDFQRAKTEYDSGNRTDADFYFNKAEQSILYVQQFFPFNEKARVLNLRISQYRDPEQFDEIFGNDLRTARNLISTNPQAAYIDLKDLEAIYPQYPGLQAAITEAEYASGIKVRPPDPAKIARSNELYDLAYSIVSRNIRSEFNVALSYLDEAISLNPENNDAIRLKDRIATDVGGTAVVVMSNTDQQLYNEAVSEFTSGNYLKARIIVENLLNDPDNQRNPKLLDLQERIERTR